MNQPQMLVMVWDDHFWLYVMMEMKGFRISAARKQAGSDSTSWWNIWKQKGDSDDVALLTAQQGIIWSAGITVRSEIMLSCCSSAAEYRRHLYWQRKKQIFFFN